MGERTIIILRPTKLALYLPQLRFRGQDSGGQVVFGGTLDRAYSLSRVDFRDFWERGALSFKRLYSA